jgi:hypothetical protein
MWRGICVPATFSAYVRLEVNLLSVRGAETFGSMAGL